MTRCLLRIFFLSIFLLFSLFSAVGLEIKSINIIEDVTWTLETTNGWQNISNTMTKEDGGSTQVNLGLNFKGILFHSFWHGIQTFKSQLNLGFDQRTHFLWTDNPDFNHNEMHLSESLRCIEFDMQEMFPIRATYSITVSPFVGYSFIEYSYDTNFSGSPDNTVMYNSMVVGIEYQQRINKTFLQSFFFSYSPIVWENYSKSKFQFINYGFEMITDTHPVSLTLFIVTKKAFLQKGRLIFEGTDFRFTTAETGFSFHINLR